MDKTGGQGLVGAASSTPGGSQGRLLSLSSSAESRFLLRVQRAQGGGGTPVLAGPSFV